MAQLGKGNTLDIDTVVGSIRFSVSWSYLFALVFIGVNFGLAQTGATSSPGSLPSIRAVSLFLHWGLSLGSVVLFLDALLHICVLISRFEGREIIRALLSGLTGVTVLILLPLKEIPLTLFMETLGGGNQVIELESVLAVSQALWLPVLLVISLTATLGGLLLLQGRLLLNGGDTGEP